MTGEEMERAIEFLLQSQAKFDAQLSETNQQVQTLVKAQAEFTQEMRQFMQAERESNESLRETVRSLTIRQANTDERLDQLEQRGNGQT